MFKSRIILKLYGLLFMNIYSTGEWRWPTRLWAIPLFALQEKNYCIWGNLYCIFSSEKDKISHNSGERTLTDKSAEIIHCQPSQNVTQKTELYRGNLNKFTSPWRPINNNKQCLAILQLSGCVIHGVLLPQHPPALRQVVPLWSVIESTKVEGSGGWEE